MGSTPHSAWPARPACAPYQPPHYVGLPCLPLTNCCLPVHLGRVGGPRCSASRSTRRLPAGRRRCCIVAFPPCRLAPAHTHQGIAASEVPRHWGRWQGRQLLRGPRRFCRQRQVGSTAALGTPGRPHLLRVATILPQVNQGAAGGNCLLGEPCSAVWRVWTERVCGMQFYRIKNMTAVDSLLKKMCRRPVAASAHRPARPPGALGVQRHSPLCSAQ